MANEYIDGVSPEQASEEYDREQDSHHIAPAEMNTQDFENTESTNQELTAESIANMSDEDLENLNVNDLQNLQTEQQETNPEIDSTNSTGEETPSEIAEKIDGMSDEEFRQFLTSEFRANGTDVKVEKAEDIRQLMQMGMNYQKKLGKIRPHLKAVKSLEQAGLLDESKLNQLIDIAQHKPEAISALMKEAEIDTFDLPDLEETPYTPENHMLSDEQYNLHEVVDNLKAEESGKKVLDNVMTWDDASKEEIFQNPALLNQLNEQVQSGLYDRAMSMIAQEEALGKIPANVSSIEKYDTVASYLMQLDAQQNQQNMQPTNNQRQVVGNNISNGSNHTHNPSKQSAGIPRNGRN